MASRQTYSNFSDDLSTGERNVNMGRHTPVRDCVWELPSVAVQNKFPDSDQKLYGATLSKCGGHTESQSAQPLNTYWRAEYYNSGCTAPPQLTTWQDPKLKGLFTSTDPFLTYDMPKDCTKY